MVKNLDERLFSALNTIPVKQCGDAKWCQLHGTRYFFHWFKGHNLQWDKLWDEQNFQKGEYQLKRVNQTPLPTMTNLC